MSKRIPFFLILLLFSACAKNATTTQEILIKTSQNTVPVYAEVANTLEKRTRGLMFRATLEENHGMLFVFDQEQKASFWMKDTFIPLDILFIGADNKIIQLYKNVPPCKVELCPLYSSPAKVLYALETNGGFSNAHHIAIGDTVLLSH